MTEQASEPRGDWPPVPGAAPELEPLEVTVHLRSSDFAYLRLAMRQPLPRSQRIYQNAIWLGLPGLIVGASLVRGSGLTAILLSAGWLLIPLLLFSPPGARIRSYVSTWLQDRRGAGQPYLGTRHLVMRPSGVEISHRNGNSWTTWDDFDIRELPNLVAFTVGHALYLLPRRDFASDEAFRDAAIRIRAFGESAKSTISRTGADAQGWEPGGIDFELSAGDIETVSQLRLPADRRGELLALVAAELAVIALVLGGYAAGWFDSGYTMAMLVIGALCVAFLWSMVRYARTGSRTIEAHMLALLEGRQRASLEPESLNIRKHNVVSSMSWATMHAIVVEGDLCVFWLSPSHVAAIPSHAFVHRKEFDAFVAAAQGYHRAASSQ